MRPSTPFHLLWLSALCHAVPTRLLARQGGPSQSAPDVVEYRDDYADNQGFSPADYDNSQGYTVAGIAQPGSPVQREKTKGQSISFTYGVNIGIEKVLGVGGTYERTVEKSEGTSLSVAAYCPEDATQNDASYRCSANLTPVFYRKNGYSIRYVNSEVDGYVTWTADIPYTDTDGFQFYDFQSCLCEDDNGGYPPLKPNFADPNNDAYLPRCYDFCGPSPSSGTLPISHSRDGSSEPLRIMIVGDSITHGHDGDFTWRYRIWQWLQYNTDIAFDLVGPYRGTQPGDEASPPQPPRLDSEPAPDNSEPLMSGGYMPGIDANFDKDHFAVWGRQFAQDINKIQQQVSNHQPDLMLVALGFNDMGWFVSDAQGTLKSARLFVENARKANPNLHFAMANVPQRSLIGGREDLIDKTTTYNNAFPDFIADLSTDDSPIHLVDFAGNYNCHPNGCPVGYDGLHPNALGEYQISQAFSRTLNDVYGLGDGPINIPGNIPVRDVAVPGNIRASPEDMGVVVQWDAVPGVSNYAVRYRLAGSDAWQQARAGGNRYDQTFTVEGIDWEFQVRSEYGEAAQGGVIGAWSGTVSATANRNTPPPPNDIVTSPTSDGLQVSWGGVNGSFNIDRFAVIIWDRDTAGAFTQTHAVRQSPFQATGLNVGHRYDIFVESWAGPGEGGLPAIPPSVIVGGGTPGKPANVQASNTDPTTVQITWDAVQGASAYRVYTNGDDAAGGHHDDEGTVVSDNHFGVAYLYPGTWHYTFCVAALNGNLESGTTCVTPPRAPGFKA